MSRTSKFIVGFTLAIAVWALIAPWMASRLIVERKLKYADAILVLSGSSVYKERAEKAASVYREGIAPRIYLTDDGEKAGWSPKEQTNLPYSELLRRELIVRGVPPEAVEILPGTVSGTIDEAEAFRTKAIHDQLRSVLLVTSAYHTRRSLNVFRNVLSDVDLQTEIGIESAPAGHQTPGIAGWWLTLRGWRFVGGEYVKSLYYGIFY